MSTIVCYLPEPRPDRLPLWFLHFVLKHPDRRFIFDSTWFRWWSSKRKYIADLEMNIFKHCGLLVCLIHISAGEEINSEEFDLSSYLRIILTKLSFPGCRFCPLLYRTWRDKNNNRVWFFSSWAIDRDLGRTERLVLDNVASFSVQLTVLCLCLSLYLWWFVVYLSICTISLS